MTQVLLSAFESDDLPTNVTLDDVTRAGRLPVLSLRTGASPGPLLQLPRPEGSFLFGGLWARHELEQFAQLRGHVLVPVEIERDAQVLAVQRLGTELMLP